MWCKYGDRNTTISEIEQKKKNDALQKIELKWVKERKNKRRFLKNKRQRNYKGMDLTQKNWTKIKR